MDVDGIVLTKLDGTAKGGIALAIAQELGVPVKLIGIGEAHRGPAPVRRRRLRPRDPRALTRHAACPQPGALPYDRDAMDAWVIWMIAAGVLAVGEIAHAGFFLGPIAVAA